MLQITMIKLIVSSVIPRYLIKFLFLDKRAYRYMEPQLGIRCLRKNFQSVKNYCFKMHFRGSMYRFVSEDKKTPSWTWK